MSKAVHLTVLERGSLTPKAEGVSYGWSLAVDYISNTKSRFELADRIGCAKGDFLLAKLSEGKNSQILSGQRLKPFYVGVVESFEETKNGFVIETGELYNLVNFDFVATYKSGTNGQNHLLALLNRYFLNDVTKQSGQIQIAVKGEPVAFSYQPSNPPTVTNLVEYLIGFFKKYGLVWEVDSISYDEAGRLVLYTVIHRRQEVFQLKNNVHDFQDWQVYVTPGNQSVENMVQIVDSSTKDSEKPVVLSTWYINQKGAISTSREQVLLPTRSKVYLYDTSATDKPTYESIARSELSASQYAHEISVSVVEASEVLGFRDIHIGMLATVVYNGVVYQSILTGYSFSSDSAVMSLTFGHIRSTIKALFAQQNRR